MEKKKTNKKPLIALAVLAIIGIIGGTFAYFTSTATFQNLFKTATYKTVVTETFQSPENWVPGTTTNKKVNVTNSGSIPVGARVCYVGTWNRGNLAASLVTVNKVNQGIWQAYNEVSNAQQISGCFKTVNSIAPGTDIASPFESVTLAANAGTNGNGQANCETTENTTNHTKTVTCEAGNLGGASFTMNVTVTTVQWDKFNDYINNNP